MPSFLNKLKKLVGPSIITGASDDDPSGIATYTQAGAGFGLHMLWMALFTLPMMVAVQEMCARIGLVTKLGLTGLLRSYYPKWVMWCMILLSAPAIVFNISANLSGMAAVGQLLLPSVPIWVFSVFFSVLLLFFMIRLPYRRISSILQYLCLALLCYVAVPFLVKVDWFIVIRSTFTPSLEFNNATFAIIVALLGTTLSPYLFFWQTSMEVEEMNDQKKAMNGQLLRAMRTDIQTGMIFSNLIFFFIVLTAGVVLFPAGIKNVETVDQAAMALKPLVGESAYLLFAIGVLGTGMLSIPVLTGSLSYMISEAFNWNEGFNKKWFEAPGFYMIMTVSLLLAGIIQFIGIPPVKALIYTAIGYGLIAPVLIAIILHICNNKNVMGKYTNNRTSNLIGLLTLLVMTLAALALITNH